jgi:hypothetical protein
MFGVKIPTPTHWLCAMYGHSFQTKGNVMVCTVCGKKVKL